MGKGAPVESLARKSADSGKSLAAEEALESLGGRLPVLHFSPRIPQCFPPFHPTLHLGPPIHQSSQHGHLPVTQRTFCPAGSPDPQTKMQTVSIGKRVLRSSHDAVISSESATSPFLRMIRSHFSNPIKTLLVVIDKLLPKNCNLNLRSFHIRIIYNIFHSFVKFNSSTEVLVSQLHKLYVLLHISPSFNRICR